MKILISFFEKSRKNKYLPKAFIGDKIYPQNFNLTNKKPYSLTQVAIPFGGGFKYAITDKPANEIILEYMEDFSTQNYDIDTIKKYARYNDKLIEKDISFIVKDLNPNGLNSTYRLRNSYTNTPDIIVANPNAPTVSILSMVPDNNGIVHIETPIGMAVKATLIVSNAAGLTTNTVLLT